MRNLHLTRTAQIFVIKLISLPRDSNMKPLYINKTFRVYLISVQTRNQQTSPTKQHITACHSIVSLESYYLIKFTVISSLNLRWVKTHQNVDKIKWKKLSVEMQCSDKNDDDP